MSRRNYFVGFGYPVETPIVADPAAYEGGIIYGDDKRFYASNGSYWFILSNDLVDDTTPPTPSPVGFPHWESSFSYNTSDQLIEATYSGGDTMLKKTLSYGTNGVDTVIYEESLDAGATWTTIGTESYQYDGSGNLTGTTWTAS